MMRNKTVLFIGNFLSSSRKTRSMAEELVDKLTERNWEILTTSTYMNRYRRLLDIIVTIIKHRKKISFAYIEIYSGLAFIWAEVSVGLLSLFNKKIIMTLHGGMLPEFTKRWPGRVRRLLREAAIITTPSHYLKRSLNHLSQDIIYLPNGLEIENYPYKERGEINPNLVWLRAFHNIYDPLLAVRIVEQVKNSYADVRLMMIGPDKHDGSYEAVMQEIERKGLRDNIVIVGAVDKSKVPEYLNLADIFINTTHYESFGVGMMEAGAVGLPIVSTNVGEIPYIWIDQENALLINRDEEEMALAIDHILKDPQLAEKLSRNARKNAETYDWENIVFQWEALFNSLILDREHYE